MHRVAKQIYNQIINAEKILLVPHQRPDGDALGSVSAFSYFLQNIAKPHNTYCTLPPTGQTADLPHLIKVPSDHALWKRETYDTIIVFDSGDLAYAGVETQIKSLPRRAVLINIDHHATNNNFGDHNLVMPKASSTAEILYLFFRYNNIAITKNMAVSLLTGLISDTENFSNPGTTELSLKIASELIRRGANFNMLKTWLLKNRAVNALRLWGEVLSRLQKNERLDIIYTFITREDLARHEASESESESIVNFLNNTNEGSASLVLKEVGDKKIKGSFRTTRDDFDVSLIASALGGGGHKKAAGFMIAGGIDEALARVWVEVEKIESVV